MIYSEKHTTREMVLKREKQLKSYKGREFVKKFITEVKKLQCSAVAQLVERLAVNEDVTGSSPVRGAS